MGLAGGEAVAASDPASGCEASTSSPDTGKLSISMGAMVAAPSSLAAPDGVKLGGAMLAGAISITSSAFTERGSGVPAPLLGGISMSSSRISSSETMAAPAESSSPAASNVTNF